MTALTAIAALLIALGVGYRLGRRSSSPRRQRRARGAILADVAVGVVAVMVARRIRRRIRRRAVNSVAVGFAKLVEPRRVPLLSPRASGSRRRYP
ncbi:hypothetical protein PJK45_23545 [Mycobacterium kansasii]|nr:hypothetical protein [Mycobacterium kansasii]MXO40018.1 hypothetical protein [Mycobacterium kansasii]UCA19701.1 hypothetical protein LA359_27205 [Mycobacterium kansasii]UGT79763.1 hypothetical protein LTS70_19235 [Mycobacterium kansasii]UGT88832.1 hypothetical protein LTT71_12625 [Mycobacterium kansasii]UGU22910.1 hypothetical protein LT351_14915 [Mycobacterium kansasii]